MMAIALMIARTMVPARKMGVVRAMAGSIIVHRAKIPAAVGHGGILVSGRTKGSFAAKKVLFTTAM